MNKNLASNALFELNILKVQSDVRQELFDLLCKIIKAATGAGDASEADFVLGELNRAAAEDERAFSPVVVSGAKSLPATLTGNADLAAMLSRACNVEVAAAAAAGTQGWGGRAAD